MTHKMRPLRKIAFHKLLKINGFVQSGQIGFQRLFHRRQQNAVQSVPFYDFPFAAFTNQWRDFSDANFSRFFQKPLKAVNVFSRSNGDMQLKRSLIIGRNGGIDTDETVFFTNFNNRSVIEIALAVRQLQRIAYFSTVRENLYKRWITDSQALLFVPDDSSRSFRVFRA